MGLQLVQTEAITKLMQFAIKSDGNSDTDEWRRYGKVYQVPRSPICLRSVYDKLKHLWPINFKQSEYSEKPICHSEVKQVEEIASIILKW